MGEPGVNFTFPARKVSWLKRDVLLFNISIGCKTTEPQFVSELHQNFAAFPTYPLALVFKLDNQDVIDFYSTQSAVKIPGVPKLDPGRLVDGQRLIEVLKPLPVSSVNRNFEVRNKILGVFDKGNAGTVVKTEETIVDADTGDIYARNVGSLFYVGQGNWNGPRGPREPSVSLPHNRGPDLTLNLEMREESAHLYRLNGDYNPLHATPEVGKQMGYGGVILHGVYAYNCIAHDLLRELGHSNPANFRKFQARFAGIVKPGDVIEADVWRLGPDATGWEEIRWVARVRGTGKVCLSDGKALIKVADAEHAAKL